jgi:actin
MSADDSDHNFAKLFLERALSLPQQHVPPLYRHMLLHPNESLSFAYRWQKAAKYKLSQPSDVNRLVNVAIEEFCAACVADTVEIFAGGASAISGQAAHVSNLSAAELASRTCKASANILHEGLFVSFSAAFFLPRSFRLFGLSRCAVRCSAIPLPLYAAAESAPEAARCTLQAPINSVAPPRPFVSVSCAARNRTACGLASWLSAALVCGRNAEPGNFGAKSATWAAKIIIRTNQTLCSRIVGRAAACPIVIDCSSQLVSAGFSDAPAPSVVFSTLMCRRQHPPGCYCILDWRDHVIGDEALQKKYGEEYGSNFLFPVVNDFVTDWLGMERLWSHVFYHELASEPENHAVLVTEAIMNPKADREKLLQTMFETFSVPALCIRSRPLLCLHASRRSTGVVVQCDLSESSIYPIIDGHVLPHAISRACFHTGNDLTSYMIALLQKRGVAVQPQLRPWAEIATRNRVRRLQEALCYVASDYDLEVQAVAEHTHDDPEQDGVGIASAISIGMERVACPEILFRPLLPGIAAMHAATDAAIKACDVAVQHRLYGNIVLVGSSLDLRGMVARMEKEMRLLAPGARVAVSAAAAHSAWAGGAALASSPSFLDSCMLKSFYDENGPSAVHSKFPT